MSIVERNILPLTATLDVFTQLRDFVAKLTSAQYTQSVLLLDHATLGQHIRHALEFYLCLIQGLKSAEKLVNYEARQRDPKLETSPEAATQTLHSIEKTLLFYDHDIKLKLQFLTSHYDMLTLHTTFYRELAYNMEHAVHHMALLRVGMKEIAPDFSFPESFGVAKSTLIYKKQ